jgi:hypothetical protein
VLPEEFKGQTHPRDTYFLFFWVFGGPTLLQFGFSVEVRHLAKLGLLVPFLLVSSGTVEQATTYCGAVVMGLLVLKNCWRIELSEKRLFLQIKMSEQKSKNMRRMLETANTPIFSLDLSGRFLYYNEVSMTTSVNERCAAMCANFHTYHSSIDEATHIWCEHSGSAETDWVHCTSS